MLQKKKMLLSALAVAGISFVGVNQTKADSTVSTFTDLQTALSSGTGTITIDDDITAEASLNSVNSNITSIISSADKFLDGNNRWAGLNIQNNISSVNVNMRAFLGSGAIRNGTDGVIGSIDGYFYNNSKGGQGGVINNGGTIGTIAGTYKNNIAQGGILDEGGVIFNHGAITSINGTFGGSGEGEGNSATRGGVLYMFMGSTLDSINGTFIGNHSSLSGGVIYNDTSLIKSISGNYTNNYVYYDGAVIMNIDGAVIGVVNGDNTADLTKTAISGTYKGNYVESETAGYGGVIYNLASRITKIDATFGGTGTGEGNTAVLGGAIYNYANPSQNRALIDSINGTFINNTATNHGGAIFNAQRGDITALSGTFKGNSATNNGGAISNSSGTITEINAVFGGIGTGEGNTASKGGAIYNSADIYSINGTFINNTATNNGGAIYNESYIGDMSDTDATAISGTFKGNSAESGGAIYNTGRITKIFDATFGGTNAGDGNTSTTASGGGFGGAIYNGSANGKIDSISADFINNTSGNTGGAISNYNNAKIGTIAGTFTGNSAEFGGAIQNGGTIGDTNNLDTIAISGTFKGNSAVKVWSTHTTGMGGAIDNEGTITKIANATFGGTGSGEGNTSARGGAIYNASVIDSISANFYNNSATVSDGGAINNVSTGTIGSNANTTAITGTFQGNSAVQYGGAIYNAGSITKIADATFGGTGSGQGNSAEYGGAIYNSGTIESLNANFIGNTATDSGGAIYNRDTGIITLVSSSEHNVLFEGNKQYFGTANEASNAIYNNGTVNMNAGANSTITFNDGIINPGSIVLNGAGTVIFNNKLANGSLDLTSGTMKLGSSSDVTLYSFSSAGGTGVLLDSQNTKYNDSASLGIVNLTNPLNINIDVDASTTSALSDSITVSTGSSSGVFNINSLYFKDIGSDLSTIASKVADGTIKDFTLQILNNNNANTYLTINSALKNAFYNESISTDEYAEDILPTTNSINWNAKYGEYTYQIKTTKDISIYGGTGEEDNGLKNALKFAATESHYNEHITTQVDNLTLINTYSDTGYDNRRIRFNGIHTSSAHGVYTMMANTALGETTAGTMTLAGVMSTGANPVRTTVDLNGNSGYDLTTNATELVLQNLILTNNKANEAIITVGNTGSKVTLNNSVVNGDINGSSLGTSLFTMTTSNTSGVTGDVSNANIVNSGDLTLGGDVSGAISNTKTLTLQGSTLNANVTGSGTNAKTVIDGDVALTAGKTIAQAVEINSGKSLTTATTGLTGTSDIKNSGTLKFNDTVDGTIAQNIIKNTLGGTVEIAVTDGKTISLAADKSITDNSLKLTSGIFDATNKANSNGDIDFTNASTGLGSGLIANGGILNVQDDKQGAINLGAVNTNNSALSIAIDAQFTTGEYEEDVFVGSADIITATISNSNNKIDVSNIKITADPVATPFKAQIADAASAGNISLSATTLTGLSAQAGSVLLGYDSATGYLRGGNSDLDNAITSTIPVKMYSIGDDEIDNSAGALTLNGTSLSITGNDKTIISTSNTEGGIVIDNNGQTLSITGAGFGSDEHYFTTAIDNTVGGTINLTDVTFNANNTTAVLNNGTGEKGLFLDGTNEFNSGITGTGKTNVVGGTTTFNADVTQSNLEIKAPATLVNNAALTITETIVNYGALTNNSTIASNSLDNVGTVTNYGGSTITVNTNINNYGDNAVVDNAGDLTANTIINAATVQNANGGTITALDKLTNANTFNNNGEVNALSMDNTGTFTNFADGTVTVNTTINNYGDNAVIDNAGDILANAINNAATVNNANGGTITATDTLTNSNIFNSNGDVAADSMDNTGTFTNYADGTVTVNTTINNYGDNAVIDNAGDILANTINNAATVNNANGGSITATDTLTNSNTFNTNGEVNANSFGNTGALTNYENGVINVNETLANYGDNADIKNLGKINSKDINNASTVTNYGNAEITTTNDFINSGALTNLADAKITVLNKLTNLGENGDIENAGTILAAEIENAATVNNVNGGSITATGKLTNSNIFNSNGDVAADSMDNTGTYTNYADGTVTVNTTINNYGDNAVIDNAGDILANTINNAATVNNANGGTITATDTLTNSNIFNTNGEVNANSFGNTGTLTNYENGVINVNETLANYGDNADIKNLGKINSKDINNASTVTNYGNAEITATNDFINSGALTNLADAKITVLNKLTNLGENGDIENAGTIIAAEIENAATVNNANGGSITATGKLTNSNIFNSNGDVAADSMDNTGTFTNYADGTVTVNTTINNYGDNAVIDNAGDILANTINNAATVNNANGGTITATDTFGSSNVVNNNGDILANALNNTGAFTNFADGNVTVNTTILNDTDGTIDNAGNVLALDIVNNGIINNSYEGTITATNDLNTTNEFNNDGNVAANTLENSGTFTNDKNGVVNVNTTLTNEGTGTFDNSGNVYATDVVNDGIVNNENGANIIASNNINNTNEFNTDGYVSADSVDNSGTFTNKENGVVDAKTIFSNTNQVNNEGVVNTETFANASGATLTNDGIVNAIENFNNDGAVNNTSEGSGILNIKNGYSNDAIKQGIINIAADNTAFDNNAEMTVEQLLNNDGTLNNTSDINVANSTNDAVLDNSGVINTKADSSITANRLVNTDATINMTKAKLTVTNQTEDILGTVNVKGSDAANDVSEMAIAGVNPVFAGELNIGNLADSSVKSTLKFLAGDINDSAKVNIAKGNVLNVAQDTSKGEEAYVVLNENDTFKGDVVLDNGTVEMKNVSYTTGDKSTTKGGELPYYEQNGGNLGLTNSTITMKDSSKISDGNMRVDTSSTFNSEKNGFNVDTLANGGLVNAINGGYENYGVKTLLAGDGYKDNQGDFNIDIYARSNGNKKYDDFGSSSSKITAANGKSGVINIADWSLNGDLMGADAPIDRKIELDVFKGSATKVHFTATDKEVFTPLGWYKLNNKSGISGKYSLDLARFNPQAYRGQVTTLAQWQNQLAIDDMLFTHSMVLPGIKDNEYGMAYSSMANKIASTDPAYAPYQYSRKDGGLWYKAYGNFEKLEMTRGLSKVGNNAYGSLIGADFGLKELRNGWKFMPTAYIGYNGAHQHFQGISAYQNGMQAGLMGTWYKDNFMVGALAYGGAYDNIIDLPTGHTDRTFDYFAGASTKASYNIKVHRDFAIQPNLFLAYNFFGQQNFHTDFGQMGMMSGTLNGVNIAPGLNLIWERETFSIYGTLQYMFNANGSVGGRGGNTDMPRLAMERGYIQYGLGATKKFTDRASGYFQSVLRNVGRTGVGFQAGFQYKLGKDYSNVPSKKKYIQPKENAKKAPAQANSSKVPGKVTVIKKNNTISLLKERNNEIQYVRLFSKANV